MRPSLKTILVMICALISVVNISKGQEPDQKALEKNIHELYSGDTSVQSQAVRQLVSAGPRAIPLLVPIVCDTSRSGFEIAWPLAAKALGELKAREATPCLLHLLVTSVPPGVGSVIMKSNATLMEVDPAFAALVQIGEPSVPAIRHLLPLLYPDQAIVAIRVLKTINTPAAREAAEAYIRFLEQQLKLATQEMEGFASRSKESIEFATNEYWAKGRVGIIRERLFVVVASDKNEIVNVEERWTGLPRTAPEVVIYFDGKILPLKRLPAGFDLSQSVVISFERGKIRVFDFVKMKGGFYRRRGPDK